METEALRRFFRPRAADFRLEKKENLGLSDKPNLIKNSIFDSKRDKVLASASVDG